MFAAHEVYNKQIIAGNIKFKSLILNEKSKNSNKIVGKIANFKIWRAWWVLYFRLRF